MSLPPGDYTLNRTVELRGKIHRLVGDSSVLNGSASPALRTGDLKSAAVILDKTRGLKGGLEHASSSSLAIVDAIDIKLTPRNGSGPIYLEDVCCSDVSLAGNTVWARQWNVESPVVPRIDNNGGTLWILGLKTEGTETVLRTSNNGRTELLGGILYATGGPRQTAFDVRQASSSLTFTEVAYSDVGFSNYVTTTGALGGGVLGRDGGSWHGLGRIIPLFRSRP